MQIATVCVAVAMSGVQGAQTLRDREDVIILPSTPARQHVRLRRGLKRGETVQHHGKYSLEKQLLEDWLEHEEAHCLFAARLLFGCLWFGVPALFKLAGQDRSLSVPGVSRVG
jgi:hypothetical protein